MMEECISRCQRQKSVLFRAVHCRGDLRLCVYVYESIFRDMLSSACSIFSGSHLIPSSRWLAERESEGWNEAEREGEREGGSWDSERQSCACILHHQLEVHSVGRGRGGWGASVQISAHTETQVGG